MSRYFQQIEQLFSKRRIDSSVNDESTLREIGNVQRANYQRLANLLSDVRVGPNSYNAHVPIGPLIQRIIDFYGSSPLVLNNIDGKFELDSPFPIITDRDITFFNSACIESEIGPKNQDQIYELSYKIAASLICESDSFVFGGTPSDFINTSMYSIDPFIAEYVFFKKEKQINSAQLSAFDDKIVEQVAKIEDIAKKFDAKKSMYDQFIINFDSAILEWISKLNETGEKIGITEKKLANFETTIREELRLNQAKILWSSRHRWALVSFWISAVFIIILLLIVPAIAIYENEIFFSFIGKIDNISIAQPIEVRVDTSEWVTTLAHLSRLVLITIPIALYIWATRIVVRFFTRSMLLMDDARQRQVMLETYFFLTEQGRADEKDRPLILQALFRPAPGHGPDSVEPPNFADILNAGLNRGA